MLTVSNFRGYALPVLAQQGSGLATRNKRRTPPPSGFFTSVAQHVQFWRAVRETFGSAGSFFRFANPHSSASPFGDGWRFSNLKKESVMCQSTPAMGTTSPHPVPSAWYELSARVSQARAVASCIFDALPMRRDCHADINHAANLAGAVIDLLEIAERDVEHLETQLKGEMPC